MTEVVAHELASDASKRFVDGRDLRHDVGAIAVCFDHFLKASDLAFDTAEALWTTLIFEGYGVRIAKSREEALTALSQNIYHFILMDYFMAGMSAEEFLKKVPLGGERTSVVLITAAHHAQQKAKDEGVADKIVIRQGDVLNEKDMADLGEASVVLLYIGDDLGARMEPLLKKLLKPGARIVSHRFSIGEWKPEKTITVLGADGDEYTLHLWIVPEKKEEKK